MNRKSTGNQRRRTDSETAAPFPAADKETVENGSQGSGRNPDGTFANGNVGGPGRSKGEPNRIPGEVKQDILDAYHERGGTEWLRSLDNRLFVRLLEKTMPRETAADVRARVKTERNESKDGVSTEELERLCDDIIARMNGTAALAVAERAIQAGDLCAARESLPRLEEEIHTHQEEADNALAKIERAKRIKATLAEKP